MISTAEAVAGLIAAATQFEGAHVCDGPQHPWLMQAAQEHAQTQADLDQCGHQGFMARGFFEQALQTVGCSSLAEIAAESWPEQTDADGLKLGMDAFKSWRHSPGHWRTACKEHKFYGAGFACSKSGIWYSTILVGD
jgi:uncharacterized protein YkwD